MQRKSVTRPTYAEIQHLVQEYEVYPPWLHCTFVCRVTGNRTAASAEIKGPEAGGGSGSGLDFWSGLKSMALTAVSILTVGATGDLKGKLAERDKHNYSEAQIQDAIVDAFLSVRGCFRHEGHSWVSSEKVAWTTELERQLKAHPIKGSRERDLLTRCLVVLAALDGKTCPAEREFLQRFAPHFEKLEATMPSRAELSEIRAEARPTVYLLALTLAMVDQDFCPEEQSYLAELAQGLSLPADRAVALRKAAGEFLVQQSLRRNPSPADEQIAGLSRLTEIPVAEIERTAERYRKNLE